MTATGDRAFDVVEEFFYAHGKQRPGWYFDMYDRLRNEHGNFRSTFAQGFWVLTRSDAVREAFQRPDVFSSSAAIVIEPDPPYKWIPEMLDPPEHTQWRQLLAAEFSPGRVNELDGRIRARSIELVQGIAGRDSCDFVTEFAERYPTSIFLELMGLPVAETDQFLIWEDQILHLMPEDDPDGSVRLGAMEEVQGYFSALIQKRRAHPAGDLMSTAVTWQIDGHPIPDADLLAFCLLMFMAGLDTVTAELTYAMHHLATHPDDRARIVAEPALIPSAIEEFLRVYNIVTPGRKLTRDIDFHGCPMKQGDMVLLPITAANRDTGEVHDADQVVIDRVPNRHIGFGLGPHRCLGSHLARREMRIALEEWHRAIPDYRLPADATPLEHCMGLIGMEGLPLEWNVARSDA